MSKELEALNILRDNHFTPNPFGTNFTPNSFGANFTPNHLTEEEATEALHQAMQTFNKVKRSKSK